MNRRHALKSLAVTAATAAFTALPRIPLFGADAATTTETVAPPAAGSFRHSVCKWCYDRPLRLPLDKFAAEVKKIGVHSIELLQLKEIPVVQAAGLECAVGYAPDGGSINRAFNRRDLHARLVPSFLKTIEECAALRVSNVICFSGNRNRGQSDDEALDVCAEGLKKIMSAAEKFKVTVIMELLNSAVDHKGYQCDNTAWGVRLADKIGSPRFKLLYDIYHMRVMGEDVVATIRARKDYIAHYHTAGVPGRHEFEPRDKQKLDYPAIMKVIHDLGFRGYVGQEFVPTRKPLESLAAAVKICTVA
jgi:hydroxypyruvate isomerase